MSSCILERKMLTIMQTNTHVGTHKESAFSKLLNGKKKVLKKDIKLIQMKANDSTKINENGNAQWFHSSKQSVCLEDESLVHIPKKL